jgi:hypothetical protein
MSSMEVCIPAAAPLLTPRLCCTLSSAAAVAKLWLWLLLAGSLPHAPGGLLVPRHTVDTLLFMRDTLVCVTPGCAALLPLALIAPRIRLLPWWKVHQLPWTARVPPTSSPAANGAHGQARAAACPAARSCTPWMVSL